MEFSHELKELYPDKIIEVKGNADALTVILIAGADIEIFKNELKKKFSGLNMPQILFLKLEGKDFIDKLILE